MPPPVPTLDEFLTVKEAAQRLKISARKMYALAASGEIAAHRFGATVRFAPADLHAYVAKCRSPATTPVSGTTNLTASSMDPDSALTAYFRKARLARRLSNTTVGKPRGSSNLRLVAKSQSR